jgi:hypothetical protein
MLRCSQMNQTEYVAKSDSSTKEYRVRAFLPNGDTPTCDCVAFAISRNRDGGKNHGGAGWCKHIERTIKDTCTWQDDGSVPQTIAGVCPACGGPAEDREIMVLPESPKEAASAVIESLTALARELEEAGS